LVLDRPEGTAPAILLQNGVRPHDPGAEMATIGKIDFAFEEIVPSDARAIRYSFRLIESIEGQSARVAQLFIDAIVNAGRI
jgi:hypothetical protein